jgi:protein associated with RNAse G/E
MTDIHVKAHKHDGVVYQWWTGQLVRRTDRLVTVRLKAGLPFDDLRKGLRIHPLDSIITYWFDRDYNLAMSYAADGSLTQLYSDMTNHPELIGDELHYTDYELDVITERGQPAFIDDEDEFAEAIVQYGYSAALQTRMRRAAADAMAMQRYIRWD